MRLRDEDPAQHQRAAQDLRQLQRLPEHRPRDHRSDERLGGRDDRDTRAGPDAGARAVRAKTGGDQRGQVDASGRLFGS